MKNLNVEISNFSVEINNFKELINRNLHDTISYKINFIILLIFCYI
jgi:hypothetical protein